jgi:hypothetical protein
MTVSLLTVIAIGALSCLVIPLLPRQAQPGGPALTSRHCDRAGPRPGRGTARCLEKTSEFVRKPPTAAQERQI